MPSDEWKRKETASSLMFYSSGRPCGPFESWESSRSTSVRLTSNTKSSQPSELLILCCLQIRLWLCLPDGWTSRNGVLWYWHTHLGSRLRWVQWDHLCLWTNGLRWDCSCVRPWTKLRIVGKTFSMTGVPDSELEGLIPRMNKGIFERIEVSN